MSLYEKMWNVMNESEAIEKNMEVGKGSNAYKAVSEAAILNMIKPLFKKYKLIIFPVSGEIKDHCQVWDKADYDGKVSQTLRAMTELKVTYRIMDIESKEYQDVVGFGNGSDSQDKGAGKAFTYSLKNALSKSFMLFSGEDTDNEHSDDIGNNNKPEPQKNKLTERMVSRAFAIAKSKGYENADVKSWALKKYKATEIADLTYQQYDEFCVGMEKMEPKSKGA